MRTLTPFHIIIDRKESIELFYIVRNHKSQSSVVPGCVIGGFFIIRELIIFKIGLSFIDMKLKQEVPRNLVWLIATLSTIFKTL